jgi:putative peptidoglycan lipid II flippase
LLGIFFAPQLVKLYASAYQAVPGKFELTVQLTRIMFPFFPLIALAAAFMGILNSCGVFFLPAFASALLNLGSIVVGVTVSVCIMKWGGPWGGEPILGMAVGVLFGGVYPGDLPASQALSKRLSLGAWNQGTPLVCGSKAQTDAVDDGAWYGGASGYSSEYLSQHDMATSQGSGAVSWLNYAFRLMQFPIGIFGVSLASATLPRVSHEWVNGNVEGVVHTLTQSLRTVFAVNLPASIGLAVLGVPILELIFQHGRFKASDTEATALALSMYAVGLTAYSAVKVLVPACYGLGNTRLPVIASLIAVAVTIFLNVWMVGPFGYWGLALGTSLAAIFNAIYLLGCVRHLISKKGVVFPLRPVLGGLFQYLFVAAVMGLVCHFTLGLMDRVFPDSVSLIFEGKLGTVLARGVRVMAR